MLVKEEIIEECITDISLTAAALRLLEKCMDEISTETLTADLMMAARNLDFIQKRLRNILNEQ